MTEIFQWPKCLCEKWPTCLSENKQLWIFHCKVLSDVETWTSRSRLGYNLETAMKVLELLKLIPTKDSAANFWCLRSLWLVWKQLLSYRLVLMYLVSEPLHRALWKVTLCQQQCKSTKKCQVYELSIDCLKRDWKKHNSSYTVKFHIT